MVCVSGIRRALFDRRELVSLVFVLGCGHFSALGSTSSTDSWLSRRLFLSLLLTGLRPALASESDKISVDEVGGLCWVWLCGPSLKNGFLRLDPILF